MPKTTIGITGLHEISGRDYGIEEPHRRPSVKVNGIFIFCQPTLACCAICITLNVIFILWKKLFYFMLSTFPAGNLKINTCIFGAFYLVLRSFIAIR